jgi:hypothetical protein
VDVSRLTDEAAAEAIAARGVSWPCCSAPPSVDTGEYRVVLAPPVPPTMLQVFWVRYRVITYRSMGNSL